MNETLTLILSNVAAICPELTNISTLALYKRLAESLSLIYYIVKSECDNTISVINETIENSKFGYAVWFEARAKEFQYDAENPQVVVFDDVSLKVQYAVVDNTLCPIKGARYIYNESERTQNLYYAVLDKTSGELTTASIEVQASFADYFKNFEIAGIPVVVDTRLPDRIEADKMTIFHDKKTNIQAQSSNIRDAIQAFSLSYKPTNNKLIISELCAYIIANINGVRGVDFTNITCIDFGNTQSTTTEVDGELALFVGYFSIDPNITINYVAI